MNGRLPCINMNRILIIIGCCMLCSCSASDVELTEDNLLFFGSTDSDVWITINRGALLAPIALKNNKFVDIVGKI